MSESNPDSPGPSGTDDRKRLSEKLRRWLPHLPSRKAVWATLRVVLVRSAILFGGFLVILLLLTAGAAWYTSRPQFCRSCHNMEPYYQSWQESSHKDVSCIECHFAPGLGGKVRGKLLGLVQLAKYVTASEGPRPAAEIPDASCLRSGCHETRLLSGKVDYHGIPFDHTSHLEGARRWGTLRCTSCHNQIVQGSQHMTVTKSTCFLCHFKGQEFNAGFGTCTRCHAIPKEKFDLGGNITFDHQSVLDRRISCHNCHRDLIRGEGEVPQERCGVCHNRQDDLKRIDDHEFMHKTHVTDHKVDCLDCHLTIEHSLDQEKMAHAASDCKSCHPDHHHEQVQMLLGTGAKTVPGAAGGMLAGRVECRTCHRDELMDSTFGTVKKGSAAICSMCHEAFSTEELHTYQTQLTASSSEIESAISRVRAALGSASLGAKRAAEVPAELDVLQDDLDFLRAGNGIHNIHYANTLARQLAKNLSELCGEVNVAAPEVELPEILERPR